MNRAEKYVYKVYQTKSFSVAAKEMYVSQPALSTTIRKLEAKLGYEIFNRKNSPVTLTREGELYVEYIEEAMELEKNLAKRMSSLYESPSKKLSIGGSNSIAHYIIPKICGEFCRRFPKVEVKIDAATTTSALFEKLNQGALDLVIASGYDSSRLDAIKLWKEKYVVVMRKDYPGSEKLAKYSLSRDEILSGNFSKDKEITDWKLFKDIKFFKPGTNSYSWKKMPEFITQCSYTSCRVIIFHKMDICYKLMLEGLGAIITPQVVLFENSDMSDNLYYFALGFANNEHQAMLVYKKGSPLSEAAQDFIEIAREMYEKQKNLFEK